VSSAGSTGSAAYRWSAVLSRCSLRRPATGAPGPSSSGSRRDGQHQVARGQPHARQGRPVAAEQRGDGGVHGVLLLAEQALALLQVRRADGGRGGLHVEQDDPAGLQHVGQVVRLGAREQPLAHHARPQVIGREQRFERHPLLGPAGRRLPQRHQVGPGGRAALAEGAGDQAEVVLGDGRDVAVELLLRQPPVDGELLGEAPYEPPGQLGGLAVEQLVHRAPGQGENHARTLSDPRESVKAPPGTRQGLQLHWPITLLAGQLHWPITVLAGQLYWPVSLSQTV
jgi:hypothetical protein